VILLVLVALWLVVLLPGLYRRWASRQPSGSIESFHRELQLLKAAGPKLVAPAFRLQTATSRTGLAPSQSGYPALASTPGRPPLLLVRSVGKEEDMADDELFDTAHGTPGLAAWEPGGRDAPRGWDERPRRPGVHGRRRLADRQRARMRRQRLVLALLAVALVSGVAGTRRSLHPLWAMTAVAVVLLVALGALVGYARYLSTQQRRGTGRAGYGRHAPSGLLGAHGRPSPGSSRHAGWQRSRSRPAHAGAADPYLGDGADEWFDDVSAYREGSRHAAYRGGHGPDADARAGGPLGYGDGQPGAQAYGLGDDDDWFAEDDDDTWGELARPRRAAGGGRFG